MKLVKSDSKSPEEEELKIKKDELEAISQELAGKELDIEELKQSLSAFQHRYYNMVGVKYVELDKLYAEIAELRASQAPQDDYLKEEATKARNQAEETSHEFEGIDIEPPPSPLSEEDSKELKALYREVAVKIHPDKATDDKSKKLRNQLMAELSTAYAEKDIDKIKNIQRKWEESPDSIPGDDVAYELVRTIRAIAQVKRRIAELEDEKIIIMRSEIHELMVRVHEADLEDRDLLQEMADNIDEKISNLKDELTIIRG